VCQTGEPVRARLDRHHRVEPQRCEVGEVVARQRLGIDVGVQTTQSAQAAEAGAHAPPVRELDRAGIADHHVRHRPAAVHEHPHLPAGLTGEAGELAGELLGDEPFRGKMAARKAL
jgi:hypothetical protein